MEAKRKELKDVSGETPLMVLLYSIVVIMIIVAVGKYAWEEYELDPPVKEFVRFFPKKPQQVKPTHEVYAPYRELTDEQRRTGIYPAGTYRIRANAYSAVSGTLNISL